MCVGLSVRMAGGCSMTAPRKSLGKIGPSHKGFQSRWLSEQQSFLPLSLTWCHFPVWKAAETQWSFILELVLGVATEMAVMEGVWILSVTDLGNYTRSGGETLRRVLAALKRYNQLWTSQLPPKNMSSLQSYCLSPFSLFFFIATDFYILIASRRPYFVRTGFEKNKVLQILIGFPKAVTDINL